jgi:hypothetical protein
MAANARHRLIRFLLAVTYLDEHFHHFDPAEVLALTRSLQSETGAPARQPGSRRVRPPRPPP